jgi:hypothetical protein
MRVGLEVTMTQIEATGVMFALVVLRLALPLGATFLFGYAMNRLMDRQEGGRQS